jgi:TAT (twin-arginine translocation) pathway signal sequence
MKTFEQYVNEAEEQLNRRGFLKGLAAFAASAAVPAPVVKLLSTPAGVATMSIPAGIALLKGIQDHLDQWDAEDDDDLFDAQEDMAGTLGFDYIEADPDVDNEYDISATDQMFDLLDLYRQNPEQAAAQLIKHLQSTSINPANIKSSFTSRADDPSDWRYQNKLKEPEDDNNSNHVSSPADIARLAGLGKKALDKINQIDTDNKPEQLPTTAPAQALPAPTKSDTIDVLLKQPRDIATGHKSMNYADYLEYMKQNKK